MSVPNISVNQVQDVFKRNEIYCGIRRVPSSMEDEYFKTNPKTTMYPHTPLFVPGSNIYAFLFVKKQIIESGDLINTFQVRGENLLFEEPLYHIYDNTASHHTPEIYWNMSMDSKLEADGYSEIITGDEMNHICETFWNGTTELFTFENPTELQQIKNNLYILKQYLPLDKQKNEFMNRRRYYR